MAQLVRVVVIGCEKVGKKSLVRDVMRRMADGDPSEFEDDDAPQFAMIQGQRTLIEREDLWVEKQEPDSEHSSLMANHRQGSSGRFLRTGRGGNKAPAKRVTGPKLRKKESIFDQEKNKSGQNKAKASAGKRAGSDQYPTAWIIVFDVGDLDSFHEAERQMEKLVSSGDHIVLVGNKTDKPRRYRVMTYDEGERLSTRIPSAQIPYIEASAKLTSPKVDKMFVEAVKKIQGSLVGSSNVTHLPEHPPPPRPGQDGEPDPGADPNAEGFCTQCCKKCFCLGGPDEPDDSGTAGTSNWCARNCKCCPRPVYTKLKKCGKICCTIM
eukprot:TRINITY_DN850_c0_g4_i2.p1 TRINITY_DN850_c0_g4~~TRINITY_DN850_c0_g4_i2.p1  ORF type:complete len:323 (+),score=39.65 TRINITY_DN850_c0_g4_i2:275-1243(+)